MIIKYLHIGPSWQESAIETFVEDETLEKRLAASVETLALDPETNCDENEFCRSMGDHATVVLDKESNHNWERNWETKTNLIYRRCPYLKIKN